MSSIFNKNKKYIAIFVAIFMCIGIGFAALTYSLRINGNVEIDSNEWIIYFDNIVEKDNNIKSINTAQIIDEQKTIIDFSLELGKVGDKYSFTVDTVNDGTIDAMIDSVELLNYDEYKDYFDFSVTYDNEIELKRCDPLYSPETAQEKSLENKRHLIVNLEYKNKMELEQDELVNLQFVINYIQLDDSCPVPEMHKLTIDPNGGLYDGKSGLTEITLNEGDVYILKEPLLDRHKLTEWIEITETNSLKDEIVTMGTEDVYVQAKYELSIEAVCKVMKNYKTNDEIEVGQYETVQECINASSNDYTDTIVMILNAIESPVNDKKVTLDLNEKAIYGTFTNTSEGDITVINGKIEQEDGVAFVNNGTLNLGLDDEEVSIDSVQLIGTNLGLKNNNIFNFYDGFIEGDIAFEGDYNKTPVFKSTDEEAIYYYPFIDHNNNKDCQRAYLSNKDRAVAKTISLTNKDIYFYNLQDAFDFTNQNNFKNVEAIRDFEAGYKLNIYEDYDITFDIKGYNVSTGYDFNNYGILEINNTGKTKSLLSVSMPINNYHNGTLSINNSIIKSTTNSNTVNNYGLLNVTDSQIESIDKYAINNTYETIEETKYNGTTIINGNSVLKSSDRALFHNSDNKLQINGGLIYGIQNDKEMEIDGDTIVVYQKSDYYAIVNNGDMLIKNITIGNDENEIAFGILNNKNLEINNGIIKINKASSWRYNTSRAIYNASKLTINNINIESKYTGIDNPGNVTINDGIITTSGNTINNGNITINGGELTTINGHVIYGTSNFIINDGTINSNNTAAIYATGTINGGKIITNNVGVTNYPVTMTGGIIESQKNGVSNSNFTMTGGIINAKEYGIYINSNNTATVNIEDKTLDANGLQFKSINSEKVGVYVEGNGTIKVISGQVYGSLYGAQVKGSLIIGENGSDIENYPSIMGESYGVYIDSGKTYFYDGKLIGLVDGHYGQILATPTTTKVVKNKQDIEYNNYYVETLEKVEPFIRVDNQEFTSINEAADYIYANGKDNTMYLIRDVDLTFAQTFPAYTCYDAIKDKEYLCGSKIIFDLDGHTFKTSQTITNNNINATIPSGGTTGNFTRIIDSSEGKTGIIIGDKVNTFYNTGTLYFDDVTLENENYNSIYNYSNDVIFNGTKSHAKNKAIAHIHTGLLTIEDALLTGDVTTITLGDYSNGITYYD